MNREIKFRAWNFNVDGIMYSPEQVEGWGLKRLKSEDCALMQYTGLKGKDGKEIYEGDIVKNEYGQIRVVAWNEGLAGFWFKDIGEEEIYEDLSRYEIIGNVYQNPELLKEKHE